MKDRLVVVLSIGIRPLLFLAERGVHVLFLFLAVGFGIATAMATEAGVDLIANITLGGAMACLLMFVLLLIVSIFASERASVNRMVK